QVSRPARGRPARRRDQGTAGVARRLEDHETRRASRGPADRPAAGDGAGGGCWPAWRSAGCAPPGSCPTCPGRWRAGSPITTRCCAAVSAESPVSIAGGLTRLSAYPADTPAWRAYHQRFYERFGLGSLVPLLDVVSDSGIGWPDGYPGTVVPARGWRKIPGAGRRGGGTAGEGGAGGPRLAGERLRPFTGDGRLRPSLRALRRCQLQLGFVLPRRVPAG